MTFFDVLSLVGGIALFLYGMDVLGKSLEKAAGSQLKSILSKLTNSTIKGLLLGVAVTAVIQSSAATTVMVVGFVNSGLMQLGQAVGVIMGANIGTTVTAWILSLNGISGSSFFIQLLNPMSFTPILAIIGVALQMFSKRERRRNIGSVMIGFAVLMFGMNIMSESVEPLKNVPEFTNLFVIFGKNPILSIIVGCILTAIIQSSSASVGILQALSATGAVTFGSAIPIIMGQHIGTCITAMIAAIGTTKNARRASFIPLYFNVIGTIICTIVFYTLNAFLKFDFMDKTIDTFQIAIVHTLFSVIYTLMLLPFGKQLERLAVLSIPDSKDDPQPVMLDERLLATPAIAVEQTRVLAADMAKLVRKSVQAAIALLGNYSEKGYNEVAKLEKEADNYEDEIGTYLVKVSMQELSDADSRDVTKILHSITDFERISDHALNIAQSAREMAEKKLNFSPAAQAELKVMTGAIDEIVGIAIGGFVSDSADAARRVEPLEEVVDELNTNIRAAHIKRLKDGECTIELGFVLNDILANFERISDHCSNIAVCKLELVEGMMDAHAYLHNLKNTNNEEFVKSYNEYREKYALKNTP